MPEKTEKGGIHMARKKTLEEVRAQREKYEEKLKVEAQNLKILKQREAELTRKERTHRLCTHGAMIEQYLNPEKYTDEEFALILKAIFHVPEVVQMLGKKEDEKPGELDS